MKQSSRISIEQREFLFYFEMELGWIAVNLANGPNTVVYSLFFNENPDEKELNECTPTSEVREFLIRSLQSDR